MEKTKEALFCDECSLQFDKKIVYDIHLSIVHKTKDKVEEETIQLKEENEGLSILCDNKKSKNNLPSLDLRNKKNISHKCSICDYTTSSKGNLKRHIDSIHSGKKPHKCLICDHITSSKGNLKQHIEAVHEGKKLFKCFICDYSTSNNGGLKRHIEAVHEGKKLYKCFICDYSCSRTL